MIKVNIVSAVKLSGSQLSKVKRAVETKHGKKISYQVVVDPAVIAGVKITIGSREFDGTVVGKLAQLRAQLLREITK